MTNAADDFATIRTRIRDLRIAASQRLVCGRSDGIAVTECWCWRADGSGSTLPCPPTRQAEPEKCAEAHPPFRLPGLTPVPWPGKPR